MPRLPRGLIARYRRVASGEKRLRGYWFQPSGKNSTTRPAEICLHTTDLETALAKVAEIKSRSFHTGGEMRLQEALTAAIESKLKAKRYRTKTATDARYVAARFASWAGNPSAARITAERLEEYYQHVIDETSETNASMQLRTLKGLFTQMHEAGALPLNPGRGVKLRKLRANRREDFCTKAQMLSLLEDAPENLAGILHLGFLAGMRFGEILAARPAWLNLEGAGSITVQDESDFEVKSQARAIPLQSKLKEYLETIDLEEPFLVRPDKLPKEGKRHRYNPRASFAKWCAGRDLPWCTYHTMRHTFGSLLAIAGVSEIKIVRWMGISRDTFDNHYAGLSDVDRDVEKLI